MNTRLPVWVLLASSIGWGLTWLPLKALNDMGLDSLQLIFIAFSAGALVLLPWLISQFASWKAYGGLMLLIALVGGFANTSFQAAIYHGDVIRVMILFYMLPVWTVLGGRLFLHERIDALRAIAVLLCLSGAFIILEAWQASWSQISLVDLMAVGSGLGLAITIILFRLTQTIPVTSKVAWVFIGCSTLTGITLSVMPVNATIPDNNALFWAILYGGGGITLISLGTQWAVTRLEAGRSAVIIVMELVAAVLSVALLTDSELKWTEIIGGLMVIIAALLEGSRSDESEPVEGDRAKPH